MTRALRNALAEVIVAALREPAGAGALQVLARVLTTSQPVEVSRALVIRLGALVAVSAADDEHAQVVVAPALAAVRGEAVERVRRGLAARQHLRRRRAAPTGTGGATDLSAVLHRAAALFDAGLYFEVHEELEVPWRDATGDTRRVLQGLVQVAVGLHHAEAGNRESMRRLLEAGRTKLAAYVPTWHGVALATLLQELRAYESALNRDERIRAPRLIVA